MLPDPLTRIGAWGEDCVSLKEGSTNSWISVMDLAIS